MSAKVVTTALIASLVVSNLFWAASFSAWKKSAPEPSTGLEVVRRDVAIRELTLLLQNKYSSYSRQQLLRELSSEFPPEMIGFDAEHVYFAKVVKFRFDEEKRRRTSPVSDQRRTNTLFAENAVAGWHHARLV